MNRLLSLKLCLCGSMCLGLHVPAGCVHSVCLDDCVGQCLYMSVHELCCQTNCGLLSMKSSVCVLPEIMPDVTSLRTVYMSEIQPSIY